MPKRIGYLYEMVIDRDNILAAISEMTKNKKNHRGAMRILKSKERVAREIQLELIEGTWQPSEPRRKTIYDGHRKKERNLLIPNLHDQIIHHAVMRVTVPLLMRRNYFYSCGSVPGAGQKRACDAIKGWMKRRAPTYAATMDIRKFYENCPHSAVMDGLRRIVKDKRFLVLHEMILTQMSSSGVGLAIGFYPSPWYANLVLTKIDNAIKDKYGHAIRRGKKSSAPEIRTVRYADDIVMVGNNRRKLYQARSDVQQMLAEMGMTLKPDWRVFRAAEGISFLGYRCFCGFTLMSKRLMRDVARRSVKAYLKHSIHSLRSVLSDIGILRQCDSFNFRSAWVINLYNINNFKRMVGNYDGSRIQSKAATA